MVIWGLRVFWDIGILGIGYVEYMDLGILGISAFWDFGILGYWDFGSTA